MIFEFDWDDGNRDKCQKHGLRITEIEAVFRETPLIAPDIKHSIGEERFIAIGHGPGRRPLFVAFVIRLREGKQLIRPISARYMHQKERDAYGA